MIDKIMFESVWKPKKILKSLMKFGIIVLMRKPMTTKIQIKEYLMEKRFLRTKNTMMDIKIRLNANISRISLTGNIASSNSHVFKYLL